MTVEAMHFWHYKTSFPYMRRLTMNSATPTELFAGGVESLFSHV